MASLAFDATSEVAPQLRFKTAGGTIIDSSGLQSARVRLQLGAGDELTIDVPSQTLEGKWRSDMPVWQQGSLIQVEAGYNGHLDLLQTFEIVSTSQSYPQDAGGEVLTVRGVSELARAARNKNPRVFSSGGDSGILDTLCAEYGWQNEVNAAALANPSTRTKEADKSDLEFLQLIAREARLGGPRVTREKTLIMPEPVVGTLKYVRGSPTKTGTFRRLHSLNMNREGGHTVTGIVIVAWDPVENKFIETEYEASEFGGDPKIVYEGPLAVDELRSESTTQGLTLAVVDHRGHGRNERVDVISTGRFLGESDAAALAKRWFELREKLSRWADAVVDGNTELVPYTSIEIDGSMAAMDRGTWLPITVEHDFGSEGWLTTLRVIRVVDDAVITPL